MTTGISTGTMATSNSTVVRAIDDCDNFSIQLTGTWAGTVTFEVSLDGTNWSSMAIVDSSTTSKATGVILATGNGIFFHECYALQYLRTRFSTATSGTVTVTIGADRASK